MNDLEKRLRDFVRDGDVPVPHVPDLVDRVADAHRRHRRRRAGGLAAAACLVAGLGVGGAAVLGDRDAVVPDPAAARACSTMTVEAAAVSTAVPDTGAPRTLSLVLDGPVTGSCTLGRGVRVEVAAGPTTASTTLPATVTPIDVGVGGRALVDASWRNWCGTASPTVRVTFTDGSVTEVELRSDTPVCTDPQAPSVLRFGSAQLVDVPIGPSEGPSQG